jgi:hypothetical protein
VKEISKILSTIQSSVDRLSNVANQKQEPLFRQVLSMLKDLETNGDSLINNINNLKVINKIKVAIEKLIIDNKYKQELKSFVESYNQIADLQNQYFSQFSANFKTTKTLDILKKSAVETTLTNLTQTGLEAGVIDGLKKILTTNISAGGSYTKLTDQLRNYILSNETGEGALERYVKTYANTAINQYSAEYNKTVAEDLGLEWVMYDGSLLQTSREFCQKCVEKKYIHVSEFATILKGDFGSNGTIAVNKKTRLPDGLMDGTNEDNFVRRRGGWNCGHQMPFVDESVVPEDIKNKVYATQAYKNWALNKGIKAKTASSPNAINVETLRENKPINAPVEIDNYANNLSIKINNQIFEHLLQPVKLTHISNGNGAYYVKGNNLVNIPFDARRRNSKWYAEAVVYHEFGHAADDQNNLSRSNAVKELMSKYRAKFSDNKNELFKDLDQKLTEQKIKAITQNDYNTFEKIGAALDTIMSLNHKFGQGHSVQYFKIPGFSEAEFIAHAFENTYAGNDIFKKYMPDLYNDMIELIKKLKP